MADAQRDPTESLRALAALPRRRSIRALAATKSLRALAAAFGVSHETVRAVLRAGRAESAA